MTSIDLNSTIIFAVTGGRDYDSPDKVFRKLSKFHAKYGFTHLVSGGAKGVDRFADQWCDTTRGVQSVVCRAHWDRDGFYAGPIRNIAMRLLNPSCLVAFPGGTGTAHMVKACERAGIKIIRVT